ncbi:hypothetical protein BU23DRAFT_569161 [Bimuria novae-zelandiae CBS 107.79]|uniref:Uncharacterized protein n=1 Tax=Bimuria novae-zelandiae CBS 107.79 TaxID=1447943 RepID=A0A6A5V7X5_9PLEO|nr:hypothetical protein BU23DRAFT_569161 [Bimuria novae-zelandiae CBS 107.79]
MESNQEGHDNLVCDSAAMPESSVKDGVEEVQDQGQYPLLQLSITILNELEASEAKRVLVKNNFKATTWPSFFLSVETARQTFHHTGQSWSLEDDVTLMSLPNELSPNAKKNFDIAFFPGRFPHECTLRCRFLQGNGSSDVKHFQGDPTALYEDMSKGQAILDEMIATHFANS